MDKVISVEEIGWGICVDAEGKTYVGTQIENESYVMDEDGSLHEILTWDDDGNVTAIKSDIFVI